MTYLFLIAMCLAAAGMPAAAVGVAVCAIFAGQFKQHH